MGSCKYRKKPRITRKKKDCSLSCDSWFSPVAPADKCAPSWLAMLELTLALPILLFIMALIINYGDDLRVEGPRTFRGAAGRLANPLAANGRQRSSARLLARGGYDGRVGSGECAGHGRQPRRSTGRPRPVAGGDRRCESARSDARPPHGQGRLHAAGIPCCASSGTYTITAKDWLIDDKWQYQRMGLPDNWERRIPVIYALAKAPASHGELLRAVGAGDRQRAVRRATSALGQRSGISFTTGHFSVGAGRRTFIPACRSCVRPIAR